MSVMSSDDRRKYVFCFWAVSYVLKNCETVEKCFRVDDWKEFYLIKLIYCIDVE